MTAVDNVVNFNETLSQIRHLIRHDNGSVGTIATLKVIKVNLPHLAGAIKMIPIEEILYFVATDKYVQIITLDGHCL